MQCTIVNVKLEIKYLVKTYRVVQLHRNTTWSVAVASSINQIDAIKIGDISRALITFTSVTFMNHVFNLIRKKSKCQLNVCIL